MIHVENLTKTFKTAKKFPGFSGAVKGLFTREYTLKNAVDNISFDIADGEIVGYIGANGAGKSTTIKMMTGILTPSTGTILVDDIIPYKKRRENGKIIGVVFGQRTQLWWDLPLNESFTLLRDIYDVSQKDYVQRMAFFNEILELNEFIMQPVRSLSLGQRMRADLAASLIHNPKYLYLDEPTIGLDVMVKERVRQAIKDINEAYNTTIVLTTHDLVDIEQLCKRIIIIDDGKKIYDGTLKQIKDLYGYMKTIKLNVAVFPENHESLYSFSDKESHIYREEDSLCISFNSTKHQAGVIINSLMSKISISDFSISETKIEDIIKKIYTTGL